MQTVDILEIMAIWNISESTARRRIKKFGIKKSGKGIYGEFLYNYKEVYKKFGIHPKRIENEAHYLIGESSGFFVPYYLGY